MSKKLMQYFSKHPFSNAFIHALVGVGIGILIARPIIGSHPVRWGLFFLILGIIGHFCPFFKKK
jgi:F0F1-type ATP synthase assembly protein I